MLMTLTLRKIERNYASSKKAPYPTFMIIPLIIDSLREEKRAPAVRPDLKGYKGYMLGLNYRCLRFLQFSCIFQKCSPLPSTT